MSAVGESIPEPVIASSNRVANIEPYAKHLFANDPKLWAQVLPWEFPQNATQQQEEEFLRRFFSEREIRMQGGSGGEGNGFRFLKSAWYWAALWNLNRRIPAIVDWWFGQADNKALVEKPGFNFNIFLTDEAEASTFFGLDEIELYGKKILFWAVKQIQARLANRQGMGPNADASVLATTKPAPVEQTFSLEIPIPSIPQPARGSMANPEGIPPTSIVTAQQSSNPSTTVVPLPQPEPGQLHTFNFDAQPAFSQRQTFNNRHRAPSTGKRGGFGSGRQSHNTYGGKDFRTIPIPSNQYAMSGQLMSQFMPAKARLTSGGQYPGLMEPMPNLPQGRPFQVGNQSPHPSIYGLPNQINSSPLPSHVMCLPGNGSSSGYPNAAYHNIQQPLADRSNGQLEFRSFMQDESTGGSDDAQFSRKQRQESLSLRGAKARGFGSLRGRAYRNRGNHNSSNAGNVVGSQFCGRPNGVESRTNWVSLYTPNHGDGTSTRQAGHAVSQDENSAPSEGYHGGDARRYTSAHDGPSLHHSSHFHQMQPVDESAHKSFEEQYNASHRRSWSVGPLCKDGCNRTKLAPGCTTARKIVIFGVPNDMDPSYLKQALEDRYGSIEYLNVSRHNALYRGRAWVTFNDISTVRDVLASRDHVLSNLPNLKLGAELALEHFDPIHRAQLAAGPSRHLNPKQQSASNVQVSAASPKTTHPPQQEKGLSPTQQVNLSSLPASDSPLESSDKKGLDAKKKTKSGTKKMKLLQQDSHFSDERASANQIQQTQSGPVTSARRDSMAAPFAKDEVHDQSGKGTTRAQKQHRADSETPSKNDSIAEQHNDGMSQEAVLLKAATDEVAVPNVTRKGSRAKMDEDLADETFYTANGSPSSGEVRHQEDDTRNMEIGSVSLPGMADIDTENSCHKKQASPIVETSSDPDTTHITADQATPTPRTIDVASAFATGSENTAQDQPERYVLDESEIALLTASPTRMRSQCVLSELPKKPPNKPKGPSQTESLSAYSTKHQGKSKKGGSKAGSMKGKSQKLSNLTSVDGDKIIGFQQVGMSPASEEHSFTGDGDDIAKAGSSSTPEKQMGLVKTTGSFEALRSMQTDGSNDIQESSTTGNFTELQVEDDVKNPECGPVKPVKNTRSGQGVAQPASRSSGRRPTLISKLSTLFTSKSAPHALSPLVFESYASAPVKTEERDLDAGPAKCEDAVLGETNNDGRNTHKPSTKKSGKLIEQKARLNIKDDDSALTAVQKSDTSLQPIDKKVEADSQTDVSASGSLLSPSASRLVSIKDMPKWPSNLVEAPPARRKHKRVSNTKSLTNSPDSIHDQAPTVRSDVYPECKTNSTADGSSILFLINPPQRSPEQKIMKPLSHTEVFSVRAVEESDTRMSPEVEAARARMEAMALKEAEIKERKRKMASEAEAVAAVAVVDASAE